MQISGAMKADPIEEAFRTVIVQGHWFPVSEVSDIFTKKKLIFYFYGAETQMNISHT